MSAEDSLAICMLAILVLAGATLMTILFSLIRNAGKEDDLSELLGKEEGIVEPPEPPKRKLIGDEPDSRQPWEKDSDWWK